ncbi:K02A2.6-like [Cordylochernes scorpioides]|uniref:K02A2.6-like n=1 Tax=Cordylochernes scorpioides TaxID=51811 RepID=A0ABY6L081_9ARAC|nr:K02A2.6-like [Cordylochernes scorpioides]
MELPRTSSSTRSTQERSPCQSRTPPAIMDKTPPSPYRYCDVQHCVWHVTNKWDDSMCLANVIFYLTGTAKCWFENFEEILNSWEEFKIKFCEIFGNKEDTARKAENILRTRAQTSGENVESYIQEVLLLCKQSNPRMPEGEKVSHLIKGVAEEVYQALVGKDISTVDQFVAFCRRFEAFKRMRVAPPRFNRLPNVTTISTAEPENLEALIRRIVREEVQKFMAPPSTFAAQDIDTPPPDLRDVIRSEIQQTLAPISAPRQPESFRPRRQYLPQNDQGYRRRTEGPPNNQRTQWRTEDDRPICFHCGRPGHVARYCRDRRQAFADARLGRETVDFGRPRTENYTMGESGSELSKEDLETRRHIPTAEDSKLPEEPHNPLLAVPAAHPVAAVRKTRWRALWRATDAIIDCGKNKLYLSEAEKSYEWKDLKLCAAMDCVLPPKSFGKIVVTNQDVFGSRDVVVTGSKRLHTHQSQVIPSDMKIGTVQDLEVGSISNLDACSEIAGTDERSYRVSPAERRVIQSEVEKMMETKIIRPSSSPWASPVILVRKKDGSLRFCVDYRRLNKITKKDVYPLPRIDDALDTLSGSRTGRKTAFITPDGLYEFNVMPFGLCNAPATFERMIDNVLRGLKWDMCLCYLDDIVVYGSTFKEHLTRLYKVLRCIQQAGLCLNYKKCHFASRQITILGHVVNEFGTQPDPEKVKAIVHFPKPRNISETRSFLGLSSYYRRFIKSYANKSRPLNSLLKKDEKFIWGEEQDESFRILKQELGSSPVLGHFIEGAETHVHTDASGYGLGAVLVQIQNDAERPIAYASRTLTKAEKNYSTTEKECLAVVWALGKFRPLERSIGRLACWALKLQEYDINIVYKSGRKHKDADCLSRSPLADTAEIEGHITSIQDIAEEQSKDPHLVGIREKLANENLKGRHTQARRSSEIITDRGRNFMSQTIREINNLNGTIHRFTTAYHPQTNGLTERLNKTLTDMISIQQDTARSSSSTAEKLKHAGFYTAVPAGRNCRRYVGHLVTNAEDARMLARLNILQAQSKDKERYDKKHQEVTYKEGDLVWVFTPVRTVGLSEKLLKRYFGPYRVIRKISSVNYQVEGVTNTRRRRKTQYIVHVVRMKPYHDPEVQEQIAQGHVTD